VGTYFYSELSIPQGGREKCKKYFWDDADGVPEKERHRCKPRLQARLLIFPIFVGPSNGGHFCLVIRERLDDGKLIYFQLDSWPTEIAEGVRRHFEETKKFAQPAQDGKPARETLWNSKPDMTVWRHLHVPLQGEHTNDCALFTCANAMMYVTVRKKMPTCFHETRNDFEFNARDHVNVLGQWARNWVHTSLVNRMLCQDMSMDEKMDLIITRRS